MAMNKSFSSDDCPVARSASLVGDKWILLIVRDAFDGVSRFGEFQRSLGVAKNILSDRLRKLVEAGLLKTQQSAQGSTYQEYVLTPKGESLFPLLVALRQWGEEYLYKPGEKHSILVDMETNSPIPIMEPLNRNGSALTGINTQVIKLLAKDQLNT